MAEPTAPVPRQSELLTCGVLLSDAAMRAGAMNTDPCATQAKPDDHFRDGLQGWLRYHATEGLDLLVDTMALAMRARDAEEAVKWDRGGASTPAGLLPDPEVYLALAGAAAAALFGDLHGGEREAHVDHDALLAAAQRVVRESGNRGCREGEPPSRHVNAHAFDALVRALGAEATS